MTKKKNVSLCFLVPPVLAREMAFVVKAEDRQQDEFFEEIWKVYKHYRKQQQRRSDRKLARQIDQMIAEVEEEKRTRPTTPEEDAREDEELRRYDEERAKKLKFRPTMREINRLIHEHRKLRRLWEES